MTKAELLEAIKDVPDDAVVCIYDPCENMHSVSETINIVEAENYIDEYGNVSKAKVIISIYG